MNDFFSSFYPLEKLQFGSDDTVHVYKYILGIQFGAIPSL